MSGDSVRRSAFEEDRPPRRIGRAAAIWLAAWVALVLAIVALMFQLRGRLVEQLGTAQAQEDWDAWRKTADEQSQSGPVRRAKTRSAEPPTLVLLAHYFGTMLGAAIIFGSLLSAALVIAVRGAFGPGRKPPRIQKRKPWTP